MQKSSPAAEQRDSILNAALELLGERGPHELTLRDVARAANCSTTGIYTWFGGKAELVEAIWVDSFLRFESHQRSIPPTTDPVADLQSMALGYREWAIANPHRYLVMFANSVKDFAPSAAAQQLAYPSFEVLVTAVQRCIDDGNFRPSGAADDTALHLWACIHGYVMLELARIEFPAQPLSVAYGRGVTLLLKGLLT